MSNYKFPTHFISKLYLLLKNTSSQSQQKEELRQLFYSYKNRKKNISISNVTWYRKTHVQSA